MPFVFREQNSLQRWRSNPISFIEEILRDPKTGAPFELFPAQQTFFSHCWKRAATRAAGVFAAIKEIVQNSTRGNAKSVPYTDN